MNPVQSEKVERFKKRVDFNAVVRMEGTSQAVSTIWPEMVKAPGLNSGQWIVTADSTWLANGGVAREWVLQRAGEQIAIVIFVSRDGAGPAQNFLLTRATENTMHDSPFVNGPAGLGCLAVSMPPGAQPNLIWVFRNVCFDVRSFHAQVDVLEIARWLQSAAERGVVGSEKARPTVPGTLFVSSSQTVVGVPVEIRVKAATHADETRFTIKLEYDRRAVEFVAMDRLSAQIRGRIAGHSTLELFLIDTATLLSEKRNIDLTFLPEDQQ